MHVYCLPALSFRQIHLMGGGITPFRTFSHCHDHTDRWSRKIQESRFLFIKEGPHVVSHENNFEERIEPIVRPSHLLVDQSSKLNF